MVKKTLLPFLLGLLAGLLVLPLGVFLYLRLGYAPVATTARPLPFEEKIARAALDSRIAHEAPKQVPIEDSEANLLAGAKVYLDDCAVCHGLKGQPPTPIAQGMFPRPPQLFEGEGVTSDSVGDTYWKVANGIRLSGMPAFSGSLSKTALWQVSLLLADAYHLPASVKNYLASSARAKEP